MEFQVCLSKISEINATTTTSESGPPRLARPPRLANDVLLVSKILLGYEKALWPKKLEISHASQILTNDRQILVLS